VTVRKYIIMGVQGSGKGTQARMLRDDFDIVHISVGDIFRWNVQNHTKLGARVRRLMEAGQLVPDDLVADVVKARLDQHDWNHGYILDGFPRDVTQARFFLESYDIDAVILIEVPELVALPRMLGRRLCAPCRLDYNLIAHRPAIADTCDVCGGRLASRPDDTPEAIRGRLRDYRDKTRPIIELFRAKELVITADGTRDLLEVQAEIRRKLELPPLPERRTGRAREAQEKLVTA
jgi:adenylate kinase